MRIRLHLKTVVFLVALVMTVAITVEPPTYAGGLLRSNSPERDDARITRLPDGTTVAEYSNRTVEILFANLLRMTVTHDDQVTIAGADNPITVARNRVQQGEMSDGTMISPLADLSLRIDLTDGSYIFIWPDNSVDVGFSPLPDPPAEPARQTVLCTFTVTRRIVNLRSGPGIEYDRVGQAVLDDAFDVIGQGTSMDLYVWWEVVWPDYEGDVYVRSDMGDSDCDPVCGNDVCEYAETSDSCAADCAGGTGGGGIESTSTTSTSIPDLVSTGEGCYVSDCQDCYESVSCYPDCNECTCSRNDFGCVTCYCTTPDSTTDTTADGCDFATCEDCIAAFPCFPEPCTNTECSLNEFGCPVCSTAP